MSQLKVNTITNLANEEKLNIVSRSMVNTVSGTSIDFSNIPFTAKRITVSFSGVSLSGTSAVRLLLGTSGAPETTGYLGAIGLLFSTTNLSVSNFSSGFDFPGSGTAATAYHGSVTLSLLGANNWALSGVVGFSDSTRLAMFGGSKQLSGALDLVRITTINGTDTFDAGYVNIMYE